MSNVKPAIIVFLLSAVFSSSFSYFSRSGQNKADQYLLIEKKQTTSNDTPANRSIIAKVPAVSFTTVGFGPANMRRFGNDKLAYNLYGGKFWMLNDYTGLGFIGEFTSNLENSHFLGISISSNYYPLKTDISPYAGADIGLAYARGYQKNAFGFSVGTSIGILFFRSSTVQLSTQFKAAVLLDKLPKGHPGSLQFRLGLLF
ncbi:MAG TPA: hypothetical protein VHP36_04940 [Chitinispirillaceae bacterium]|nr:hypothetical protein [Chitinispirillaceae bacterium]